MTRKSALFIVATPIGNLSDITIRAVDVLKSVDFIAAEDTRHSAKLLSHFDINTPLRAYHDHGGEAQVDRIIGLLKEGKQVALISDAGTPLISDPGYRLVKEVVSLGVQVVPIPGPCALVAALSAAGLPSDAFAFQGFPAAKSAARKSAFSELAQDERTLIFYESPHRIRDSLQDMCDVFGGERQAVLARELTKTYETFLSGSFAELLEILDSDANQLKGEMIVLVHGYRHEKGVELVSKESERLMLLLLDELPLKKAAALTAKYTGDKKNDLYQWGVAQKEDR